MRQGDWGRALTDVAIQALPATCEKSVTQRCGVAYSKGGEQRVGWAAGRDGFGFVAGTESRGSRWRGSAVGMRRARRARAGQEQTR